MFIMAISGDAINGAYTDTIAYVGRKCPDGGNLLPNMYITPDIGKLGPMVKKNPKKWISLGLGVQNPEAFEQSAVDCRSS